MTMNGTESIDTLEIHQLLARYSRSLDTRDWELYRSVFTEDAFIDNTSAGIPEGPVDEVADALERTFANIPWTMHYLTNVETDITDSTARARAMFLKPMGAASQPSFVGGGYHYHHLIRTPDGWRSRYMREESIWSLETR
jgi:SnoaL-like domain